MVNHPVYCLLLQWNSDIVTLVLILITKLVWSASVFIIVAIHTGYYSNTGHTYWLHQEPIESEGRPSDSIGSWLHVATYKHLSATELTDH